MLIYEIKVIKILCQFSSHHKYTTGKTSEKKVSIFLIPSTHHRAAQLRAAQKVQVQMEHCLAGVLSSVEDCSEACFLEPEFFDEFMNHFE